MSKEYKFERVSYESSTLNNGEFIPRISIVTTSNNNDGTTTSSSSANEEYRKFQPDDMVRVLDFENMPEAPPNDAVLGHLEFELDDDDTVTDDAPPKFPKRYFVIRGSYVFYFALEHVDGGIGDTPGGGTASATGTGIYQHQTAPRFKGIPRGVMPLERTVVEFPPGGRRCFREHAKTDARQGYEMMIRHRGRGGVAGAGGGGGVPLSTSSNDINGNGAKAVSTKRRAPAYIVFDTNGQRELWKNAIVNRAEAHRKDTKLRSVGAANLPDESMDDTTGVGLNAGRRFKRGSPTRGGGGGDTLPTERRVGGNISVLAGVMETEEQKDIEEALEQFGNNSFFEEADWVNQFFVNHDEYESMTTSRKLERWQISIKKGLRGAVLEQYEYFVEASKEMTIMGREIAALKELVLKQVETVESMKNVSFELGSLIPNTNIGSGNSNVEFPDDEEDLYSSDEDGSEALSGKIAAINKLGSNDNDSWADDDNKNGGGGGDGGRRQKSSSGRSTSGTSRSSSRREAKTDLESIMSSAIEVPAWLDDVVEEISAFIKECRYSDATDLLLKAKTEINEIMGQHDKLTEKKLSKKQLAAMQRILRSIDNLTNRMCKYLSEGLRRKNDAFRHITKKERNDPLLANAALVSPIALDDDASALHLLVKLGRSLDAATAYSTRRSLLLTECLHERPICHSSHSVDVVIYAAQISHSFFNSLAMAVEGFLDLFAETDKSNIQDDQSVASSINTGSLKTVPANALAATCLWCDSETLKFAAAFGTKVLGHLELSPRVGSATNAISDKINQFEAAGDLAHFKKQLHVAVEMGEYEIAEKLRKKITKQEQDELSGKSSPVPKSSADKDRKAAIEIAAKCIDQAFEFATEFLNTIGLPLTPRLAEYLRPRLKGTEAEIAVELEDKWEAITFNWRDSETHSSD